MHISNLYADGTILLLKRCFASEKIHGTSSHLSWRDGHLHLFPGGCKLETFKTTVNEADLVEQFTRLGHADIVVFGEQYGGKQQGMAETYGKTACFSVFEVKIGDTWLNVPNAADVAAKLGLEFVPYREISTDLAEIDAERDRDSEVAVRRGQGPGHRREGVVLRPLQEFRNNRGDRVIAKHKREEFRETRTPRQVGDPHGQVAGESAAFEWVTNTRMTHVVDHLEAAMGVPLSTANIPDLISAMIEDVEREGAGEVMADKATRKAISARTVKLFQGLLRNRLVTAAT
jgi:hypothetical protein